MIRYDFIFYSSNDDVNQNKIPFCMCVMRKIIFEAQCQAKTLLQYSIFAYFAQHFGLTILENLRSFNIRYSIWFHMEREPIFYTPLCADRRILKSINMLYRCFVSPRIDIMLYDYMTIAFVHMWNAVASSSISSTLGIFE